MTLSSLTIEKSTPIEVKNKIKLLQNIIQYNKIDKDLLIETIFENVIDSKKYSEKITILNEMNNLNLNDKLESVIKNYFKKFIVNIDGVDYIYISDYSSKNNLKLLKETDGTWKEIEITELSTKDKETMDEKFKTNLANYNTDLIGFISPQKETDESNYVMKFKELKLTEKGRINRGKVCLTNSNIIPILNNLYILYTGKKKYYSESGSKKVTKVFNFKKNKMENLSQRITTKFACMELGILISYLNKQRFNNKKWLFNSLESVLYNVSKIPANVDTNKYLN